MQICCVKESGNKCVPNTAAPCCKRRLSDRLLRAARIAEEQRGRGSSPGRARSGAARCCLCHFDTEILRFPTSATCWAARPPPPPVQGSTGQPREREGRGGGGPTSTQRQPARRPPAWRSFNSVFTGPQLHASRNKTKPYRRLSASSRHCSAHGQPQTGTALRHGAL